MIGTAISTVRSFYSASHYEWAAYERPGIGLSYIFSLAAIIFISLTIGISAATLYTGEDYGTKVIDIINSHTSLLTYLSSIQDSPIYKIILIVVLSLAFTFIWINLAIFVAILAMPINYGLNARMHYDQLLRVTVYAMVPPAIITLIVEALAKPKEQTLGIILFFIAVAVYESFAIICSKLYLNN